MHKLIFYKNHVKCIKFYLLDGILFVPSYYNNSISYRLLQYYFASK